MPPPVVFKMLSRFVLHHISIEEVQAEWEHAQLGRPGTNIRTIKRWMSNGPKSKNRYFEPFICELTIQLWIEKAYANDYPLWDWERWDSRFSDEYDPPPQAS